MLPGTVTQLLVPPTFLVPNSQYQYEVLAIETSGNQTLSEATFRTGP
jgi:hypothetical protein